MRFPNMHDRNKQWERILKTNQDHKKTYRWKLSMISYIKMPERTEGETNECEQYVITAKLIHRLSSPWYTPMGTKALSSGMSDAVRCSLSSSSHLTARLRLPT